MKKIFEKLDRFFQGKWRIAVLDLDKGRWMLEPKISYIPYLKAENANGRHIIMQPLPTIESHYLLVDDIAWSTIEQHHRYNQGKWRNGRLVTETSANNYQIWIRSNRSLSLEEKRFWLKRLCSDPGADPADRWGRCPGFRNRKEKYRYSDGGFPLARLIWIDWKQSAIVPQIIIPDKHYIQSFSPQPRAGVVCHDNTVSRLDFAREDESTTDFAYTLSLLRKNLTNAEIKQRLLSERSNWKNHQGKQRMDDYLDRTIKKARQIIQNS